MRCFVLSFGLVLVLGSTASGTTYVVRPDGTGDFPTIQAAIDSALDGDTIKLTDGTFRGEGNRNIHYWGKAITICGQSGDPSLCTIDCEGQTRGFKFNCGESSAAVLRV